MKLIKKIKEKKGSILLSFVIVVAVVAIVFTVFIPNLWSAFRNRHTAAQEYIQSVDTKIN